jgi:hypothetical protein
VYRSRAELLYDWRFTAHQFVLVTSPLRLTTSNFIFQLNTCSYSPYVASSLAIGWVCCSQLLLVLTSAVILRFESRGTHARILQSQIRDSPNLEGQVPVFISPRNRVAQLHPQALGSLFVASYDSQGYGGGIRPRLHTGLFVVRITIYILIHYSLWAKYRLLNVKAGGAYNNHSSLKWRMQHSVYHKIHEDRKPQHVHRRDKCRTFLCM